MSQRRYRYNGKERDEETGLYYYGARYYAAWLGRWTAVDPGTPDGTSRYAYVHNRPIQLRDPDGRNDTDPNAQLRLLAAQSPTFEQFATQVPFANHPFVSGQFHDLYEAAHKQSFGPPTAGPQQFSPEQLAHAQARVEAARQRARAVFMKEDGVAGGTVVEALLPGHTRPPPTGLEGQPQWAGLHQQVRGGQGAAAGSGQGALETTAVVAGSAATVVTAVTGGLAGPIVGPQVLAGVTAVSKSPPVVIAGGALGVLEFTQTKTHEDIDVVAIGGAVAGVSALRFLPPLEAGGAGVVYLRTNPLNDEPYVGQAKSPERFEARQLEHDRKLGVTHDFKILSRAEPGTPLDVREEDYIRKLGGPQREGGPLANKRHQMSDTRYQAAGGRVPYNPVKKP